MRAHRFIGILAAVMAAVFALAVSGQPAAAATVPGFCSVEAVGGSLDQVVSGTTLGIQCRLSADERTPYWLVLKTDGDPAAWTVTRLDSNGNVVAEEVYASPEVIVPAGEYIVQLDAQVPSIVEVLTRQSGLREEVARAQTKALFTAEVRAAPSGTNILEPQVRDLTQRITTLADIRTLVVHPFHAMAEAQLRETEQAAASLMAKLGADWAGAAGLERDLTRARAAFEAGQLDRVGELSVMIQRYVAGDAQAAEQIGRLDSSRLVALRATVVIAAVAVVALGIAGGAVYILLRRYNLFGGTDDAYEAIA